MVSMTDRESLDVPSSNQLLTKLPDSSPLPPLHESPSRCCNATMAGWELQDCNDTGATGTTELTRVLHQLFDDEEPVPGAGS